MLTIDFSFRHNNAAPFIATGYYLYRQSGLAVSGFAFNEWTRMSGWDAVGTTTGEIIIGSDATDIISGVDYNYKVSAINTTGETFGVGPVYSGINFADC